MSHYGDQSLISWTSNQYSKWPYVNNGITYCVEKMLANHYEIPKINRYPFDHVWRVLLKLFIFNLLLRLF